MPVLVERAEFELRAGIALESGDFVVFPRNGIIARNDAVTSRNASSIDTGSTWSVNRRRISKTWDETAEYLAMSGRT